MIGAQIGSYKVLEKLGEGGMGAVYRAIDEMVERQVALKVLRSEIAQNAEVVERFRSEAIALARLNHPAIATLYSFFRHGEQYFMAMEFVPGDTLEKEISRGGAMPWQKATEILLRILEGIRHAHQMAILHRDLKPANIMLAPDGGVKVTDFGIARVLNTVKLTREARVVGTLEYLAPERALGRPADARSDLYSLGIVYYEMLTGRLPFQADTDFALMRAQIEEAPARPREIGVTLPPPIEAALMKALAKNPEERFTDAAEFAAAFRDAVRSTGMPLGGHLKPTRLGPAPEGSKANQVSTTPPWQKFLRDRRIAAGCSIVLIGAAALAVLHKPAPKPVPQPQNVEPLDGGGDTGNGIVPIAPPVSLPAQADTPPPEQPVIAPPVAPPSQPVVRPPVRNAATPAKPARETGPPVGERILAALEETDDPATASTGAGSRPLQWTGINKAMRVDRVAAPPVITQAAEHRGVNFRATPDQLIDLRVAGATEPMLHAIVAGYRAPATPEKHTPPTAAPVAPPPAPPRIRTLSSLRDVRRLYVAPLPDNLDEALRQEITRETKGRLVISTSPETGDAIMQIEIRDEQGNPVIGAAGRVFGLRDKRRALVKVVESYSKKVLWSAEEGDKPGIVGRPFGDPVRRLASRIAKRLKEDWVP